MELLTKKSECSSSATIHCLLCDKAMNCCHYLLDRYPGITSDCISIENREGNQCICFVQDKAEDLIFMDVIIEPSRTHQRAVILLNDFMEDKLSEIRENLMRVKNIDEIQEYLTTQKDVIKMFGIQELSISAEERQRFEEIKKQYIALFELYLI